MGLLNNYFPIKMILFIIFVFVISFQKAESKNLKLFSRIDNPELLQNLSNLKGDENTSLFVMNKVELEQIIYEKPVLLQFQLQLSDKSILNLKLYRYEIFSPTATVCANTELGKKFVDFREKIINYRGKVIKQGEELSVNFTFSPNSVNGMLFSSKQTWVFGNYDKMNSENFILFDENNIDEKPDFACDVNDSEVVPKVLDIMSNLTDKSNFEEKLLLNDKELNIDVAVETDYQTFQNFGNDTIKAIAYISGLYSVSSQLYERDLNTKFSINYINFWTTPEDPYNDGDNSNSFRLLNDVTNYWNKNFTNIKRTVVNYLSLRTQKYGGLVQTIGEYCNTSISYAFCSIYGNYDNLPSYSWDVAVIVHENGHLFGSIHTHNCMWPQGALDSCALPDDGKCYNEKKLMRGTIMSYCHNSKGMDMEFHPLCKQVIRANLETSPCVGNPNDVENNFTLSGKLYMNGEVARGLKLNIKAIDYTDIRSSTKFGGNQAPGGNLESITDSLGNYSFNKLATGYYEIVAPEGYGFYDRNYNLHSIYFMGSKFVLVPGQDIQKNLYIDKFFKIPIEFIGEQKEDNINICVIKNDSNIINKYIFGSIVNKNPISLLNGSYTIIPYSPNLTFLPKSITVSDGDTSKITFNARTTSILFNIIGIVKYDENDIFIPQENMTIISYDRNKKISKSAKSDKNGVFIFDSLDTKSIIDVYLSQLDTTKYTENNSFVIDSYENAVIFSQPFRKRILPAFTYNYQFSSKIDNYSEIEGDTIGVGNYIPITSEISLPFSFNFGNKQFQKIYINKCGYISLGAPINESLWSPIWSFDKVDGIISPFGNYLNTAKFIKEEQNSYLITNTSGNSPKRVYTIQYKNFYSSGTQTLNVQVNFQIKLYEENGDIEFVYGNFGRTGNFNIAGQIGIRGSDHHDFNNRIVTTDWSNSERGQSSSDSVICNQNTLPTIGLTYKWSYFTSSVDNLLDIKGSNSLDINPTIATDEIAVKYNISRDCFATIELYDLLGNKIQILENTYLTAGNYSQISNVQSLNKGIYYCVLNGNNECITKKFIVIR